MRLGILIITVFSLLVLVACSDPAATKSKAVTSEAGQVSPQTVQGQKYVITPQNSKIEFTGSKVTGSENGSFGDFSGQIDYSGNPETSRVNITIKIDSVKTDSPGLETHLKTADFFDAAKYPETTFVSTSIKPGGENGATHTITGNLNMHGVTKGITFPATITVTPDAATVESSFSINRKEFGINYPGKRDDLIRDNVVLTLHIQANKGS
ncbi:MAG TPA: YceI family protein [Pyrinomonadaceae bacterium]|nr:YceI family protein [Pyrinomonadaceae bacterium]